MLFRRIKTNNSFLCLEILSKRMVYCLCVFCSQTIKYRPFLNLFWLYIYLSLYMSKYGHYWEKQRKILKSCVEAPEKESPLLFYLVYKNVLIFMWLESWMIGHTYSRLALLNLGYCNQTSMYWLGEWKI